MDPINQRCSFVPLEAEWHCRPNSEPITLLKTGVDVKPAQGLKKSEAQKLFSQALYYQIFSTIILLTTSSLNFSYLQFYNFTMGFFDGFTSYCDVSITNDEHKTKHNHTLVLLTRQIEIIAVGLRRPLDDPNEELAVSFTGSYKKSLEPYHSIIIRPIFK
ncbi:26705_t:CDS:2, partial [Gigaspora margarita]